jgi:hypothetical protein
VLSGTSSSSTVNGAALIARNPVAVASAAPYPVNSLGGSAEYGSSDGGTLNLPMFIWTNTRAFTSAEIASIYSSYKTTIGTGLGLP